MKIFAYTMKCDTGFAPAVKNNLLTLACCKTQLRYNIAKDLEKNPNEQVLLMGLCGKELLSRNNFNEKFLYVPIYIAKINRFEKVTDYYSNKQYNKRPDQKYCYDNKSNKWFIRANNPHHIIENLSKDDLYSFDEYKQERDLFFIHGKNKKENFVLFADEYIYFGKNLKPLSSLPTEFKEIQKIRLKSPRTSSLNQLSKNETENIFAYFEQNKLKYKYVQTVDEYFEKQICKVECKTR